MRHRANLPPLSVNFPPFFAEPATFFSEPAPQLCVLRSQRLFQISNIELQFFVSFFNTSESFLGIVPAHTFYLRCHFSSTKLLNFVGLPRGGKRAFLDLEAGFVNAFC